MKVFSIKITLLILIIVAAIIATGYLSYKNLSQIVQSIHREARPDYKLIKIKEINADLSEVDNSVRLYSLTKESKYLRPYDRTISSVDKRVDELLILQGNDTSQVANIHAIQQLIGKKIVVWDRILKLHAKPVEKEVFDQFYTTIEKKTTDSISPPKDNLLKRIFKKKKDKEITLGKEEVTQEVAKLERSLSDKTVKQAETETQLLKTSNRLSSQLQFLILQLEQKETESLFLKSLEAEVLAENTYKWLAVFCVAAVLLLITVLLIILNYSRKSSQSQRALRQAKTEADNLVKAKELFTANVSHELRTP
ncbi:MAG TPA: CHASE3 domain-containing protein, partial [Bacteroidales bacterium]|nr:CHASE3 domain-containing protein [Bacteroidales bacterium]